MRLATWNVNSVQARLPRLLAWLEETRPETPQQTAQETGIDPGPDQPPLVEPPTLWPRATAIVPTMAAASAGGAT